MASTYGKTVTRLKAYAPWAVVILLVIVLWSAWYKRYDLIERFVSAPPWAHALETRTVEVEKIVYIDKKDAEGEGIVPDHVKASDNLELTAVGVVPPHEGDTTIVSILDTGTGLTTLDIRQERPSLFALPNRKALGVRCDLTTSCNEVTFYGAWEFLRVGAIHMEAYGEIGTGKAYIGMGAEYRF
jgi:hypothetical protein